uniref:Uncharacterized protein LOC111131102 isoform X2 n=1 Tax=Crassostrea virginica TaxID=6565 RepID=A0A8B8E1S4_CRAVI|nr:uncharacterized protein LOC111131102 isoform X2 [Crassostrea virginica]
MQRNKDRHLENQKIKKSDIDENTDSVLMGSEPVSDLFDGRATLPDPEIDDSNDSETHTPCVQSLKTPQDKELLGYMCSKNTKEMKHKHGHSPCMSRNAIIAREHRQRKKELMKDLEQSVGSLKKENSELKTECNSLKKSVEDLTSEVQYLKGVLANQSTLATILHKISDIPGLTITSSLNATGTNNNNNTSTQTRAKRSKQKRCLENQENEGKNNEMDSKKRKVTRSAAKQSQHPTRGDDAMQSRKTAYHPLTR